MIELVIKKFLDGQLDVPSFFEHKPNMPESYVILEKTGSGGSRLRSFRYIRFSKLCTITSKGC
ncbi:gp45 [Streptococcus pneumoniae]|nr:gp45 [Streptococcus pneumoniae]